MRAAFFLLVLANLVFFTWAQGYWGGQDAGREPQRLKDQLHPEKMNVAPPPPQGCRRVEGLTAKDAEKLQLALQNVGLATSLQNAEEGPSFWVNIPALANKAAVDKKVAELKALGVTDFQAMQGESGSFVISLGLFRSEGSANEFLLAVNKKGVKSARVETRRAPPPTRIEVRGAADVLAARLPDLLAGLAGASAVACP